MESEEGLEKVQDALRVCSTYKETYHIHRGKLAQYFKSPKPVVEWSFQPNLIFARLDQFLDQLKTIEVTGVCVCVCVCVSVCVCV